MTDTPKVSVCITAYNQADYIAQALDSVLGQKTDFPIEIIVGEDESTDGTREIVGKYASRYAGRIRPFFNNRDTVMYFNGRATGHWNFVNNIRHARGRFVALLDGDDYWTDDRKLQSQVEALETEPDCSFCFHLVKIRDEESGLTIGNLPYKNLKRRVSIEEILSGFFIATCSVMFRRENFQGFPGWYTQAPAGDWTLFVLNAVNGPAFYIDEPMAVYRVHGASYWSSQTGYRQRYEALQLVQLVRKHIPPELHHALDENEYQLSRRNFHSALRNGHAWDAWGNFRQMLRTRGPRSYLHIVAGYLRRAIGIDVEP